MHGHAGWIYFGPKNRSFHTLDAHAHARRAGSHHGARARARPAPAARRHHASRAHNDAIAGLQFDDTKVVSSGFDSLVRLWDLRTLTERAVLQTPVMTRCTRHGQNALHHGPV